MPCSVRRRGRSLFVSIYLTIYFGTVGMAMFLVPIVSRLAKKYRYFDDPDPRKVHQTPIPRIGGIALFTSTLSVMAFVFFASNHLSEHLRQMKMEFLVLLAASSFIFAVGLIDDLRSLPGYIKLSCVIAASLDICASGATLRSVSMGTWFELETGWAAWPLTVLWIVTITACMNLIDGLDGLAAGITFIVCGTIALMAFLSGQLAMVVLMLALLGSVTGFLFFNFYPAKIFMGDCGSMFLGFMIGAGSIVCQSKTSTFVGLALPFLAMGVPILDAGVVVIRRHVIERRSMFAPDRGHLHHRLLSLGLHQRTAVIVIYALTGISASIGVFMLNAEGRQSVALFGIGLLLLIVVFASLHGRRCCEIAMALRHNRTVLHESRIAKHDFEDAQIRMQETTSFSAWWETLCDMARQMHFQSIGVWNRSNDRCMMTRAWHAVGGTIEAGKTMKLTFPLQRNGIVQWEIRAHIWINSFLESSGHHAMLLARLMDEFPPPPEQEIEPLDPQEDATVESKTGEVATSTMTMGQAQTLTRAPQVPAPLDIMGIPVVPFKSYDQALECIEGIIESNSRSFWMAVNPTKAYHAWHDPELKRLLLQADVAICDGVGISMAAKILYGQRIERCTGCDLFFKLLNLASRKGWGVYLLGASPKSNAAACSNLQKMYPSLKIVGAQDGYFEDSNAVVRQINRSGAKMLFVAMGSPKQEYWIWCHRRSIAASFCMGVGGSLDIASGDLARAPKIFRATGTEFLYRLGQEPRKRWRMQKILIPYFIRIVERKLMDVLFLDDGRIHHARH
ncbi:MAG: hypothetical protein A2Z25_06055 [Planctomycetes bacterium RBG_16_55_9]|nr:MAG: hypothetical protein A2Z25_06055 [Planctomycetes bacterium RBG_16_55_9]